MSQLVFYVVHVIILIIQMRVSFKFFKQARHIAEVGKLAKRLIIAGNVSTISSVLWEVYLGISIYMCQPLNIYVQIPSEILRNLPLFFAFVYWMRFLRVQVQLRAQKEKTVVIMKSMRNSNRI